MGYQSEQALEEDVIKQLVSQGYERVQVRDHAQLVDNFRSILNERNADKLEGKPLSDAEFRRIMIDISDKSIFDSAMILRDKYVLERDDETKVYLSFMDTLKWCKNKFQVTNQVSVEDTYKSRYDVTILINGLPLVQIELKEVVSLLLKHLIKLNDIVNLITQVCLDSFNSSLLVIRWKHVTTQIATKEFLRVRCFIGAIKIINVSIT